jgi:hypothetical protein
MKTKTTLSEQKNTTVRAFRKSNRKFTERSNIYTHNIQKHEHSLTWLDIGTTIKRGEVNKNRQLSA